MFEITRFESERRLLASGALAVGLALMAAMFLAIAPDVISQVDLEAYAVSRSGQSIDLTPTEFAILKALAGQPGRVFSRLQLLESSQGTAYEGYERTIDAHIKNLRAKLEPNPREPAYIQTVFGVGYRFTED